MKDTMKGIIIGIIATVLFGVTCATVIYTLNKINVHDTVLNDHAAALRRIFTPPPPPAPESTKKRR